MAENVKLIHNWKDSLKFWSVRLGLIGTAITSLLIASPDAALYAWSILPEDLKHMIPERYTPLIGVGVFALSMLARLLKQKKLAEPETVNDEQPKT